MSLLGTTYKVNNMLPLITFGRNETLKYLIYILYIYFHRIIQKFLIKCLMLQTHMWKFSGTNRKTKGMHPLWLFKTQYRYKNVFSSQER